LLLLFKGEIKMIEVTRKGDISPVTFIEFLSSEEGVTVCVHPDKHSIPVSESVRLCGANAGGRSRHMYEVLAVIEQELGVTKGECVLNGDDGQVTVMRGRGDSDFTIKTHNPLSSNDDQFYGAKVFFRTTNQDHIRMLHLMEAAKSDNQERPIL
jgi:hypothetical protein